MDQATCRGPVEVLYADGADVHLDLRRCRFSDAPGGCDSAMTTKLDGPLKRQIEIAGTPYTLTVGPDEMTLVLKGRRKGFVLKWSALVSGDAAIATALNASLTANLAPKATRANTPDSVTAKASTTRSSGNRKSKRRGGR